MKRAYRCISADSHLEIDSKWWVERVPQKYREQAPRVIRLQDGSDAWLIQGRSLMLVPGQLFGGKTKENWKPFGQTYETSPGAGSAEQRLREQDIDGVDAEVLFPGTGSGPRFWRNIRDDAAFKGCVRAYNEFLAKDYCAVAPDRLIGLGVIPMTGLEDAIDELKHVAKLGLKGVVLDIFPSGKGHPTPEDDRFWKLALEMRMPVCVHQEMDRQGPRGGPYLRYERPLDPVGRFVPEEVDLAAQTARFGMKGFLNPVQMALDGLFERLPELEIYFAETAVGWLPFAYEGGMLRFEKRRYWAEDLQGWRPLPRSPIDYIKKHIIWGFQQDSVGVRLRDLIGVDRMMWASDFPHVETQYPHSRKVIDHNFRGVPAEETYKMVAGNAVRFFNLGR